MTETRYFGHLTAVVTKSSNTDSRRTEPDSDRDQPSSVSGRLGLFDRLATAVGKYVSRAWFFTACVLLVVLWGPSILFLGSVDTWQLIINTLTTIVTFLLVALLQNTQTRNDQATQHKLNAIAEALAGLMSHVGQEDAGMRKDIDELRQAVGLEERESS
jgi:low affinity Fe/Cu permease